MDDDGVERRQTNLRLATDIKRRLEADAKRNRRRMSAHAEHILDQHLPPLDGERAAAAG